MCSLMISCAPLPKALGCDWIHWLSKRTNNFGSASNHKNSIKLFQVSWFLFLPFAGFNVFFFSCYLNTSPEFLWIYNIFNWCEIENISMENGISVLQKFHAIYSIPRSLSLYMCVLYLFYSLVVVVRSLIIWFLDCGIYNHFPVNQVYYIQNHNVTT